MAFALTSVHKQKHDMRMTADMLIYCYVHFIALACVGGVDFLLACLFD